MSEILTIRNFGPIKDMTLELRVVNIFIGNQSTGKSTVAKVLSLAKQMFDLSLGGDESKKMFDYKEHGFQEQLEIHGLTNYLKSDTYIEFDDSCDNFKYQDGKIFIKKGERQENNKNTRLKSFIPSYREAAVLLKDDLFGIIAHTKEINWPQLFSFFGQEFIVATKSKKFHDYTDILGIKYELIEGEYKVVLNNGVVIEINESASAIISGIPLLIVFDKAVESMYSTFPRIYHRANRPYIIIEEPELNCFPITQKKLMEHFISKIKFEIKEGFDYYCGLLITTHSPYILTSLNNMMYAYQVGQKEPVEVNEIINKKYWINPDDVSAYMLLADGTCEDILDREEGLIKAEKIDGVTNILNEQFNSLLNLQLSENEFDTN